MLTQDKIDTAILECYSELYKHSTPKLDFNKAFKERKLEGHFYLKYEMDKSKCDEIIESIIKKYKIKTYQQQMFRNSIYLGCSPKFKKE